MWNYISTTRAREFPVIEGFDTAKKQQCLKIYRFIRMISYDFQKSKGVVEGAIQAEDIILTDYYYMRIFIRFKKRSLYITLSSKRRQCLFTFSSGMFVPGYNYLKGIKSDKKKQLDYVRSLKKKDKKLFNKKLKVRR